MKIVADSKIPYLKGLLEPVAQEVAYVPGGEIDNACGARCTGAAHPHPHPLRPSVARGQQGQFIGTATIGTDHIDLDYCRHHGIAVENAPGCNAPAVAQWVHASILQWVQARNIKQPLTLGIVGVGHVGSIVARWARQLGYRVLLNDPPLAEENAHHSPLTSPLSPLPSHLSLSSLSPLPLLQRECDIITFHTPLTREGKYPTWHLCDKDFLDGMQRCKLIINAARGAVCDNEALLQWHGDLALDCWEGEPSINRNLLNKAMVATPHIAGYSLQGKQRGTAMIVEALNRRYGWHITPQQASTPLKGASVVTAQSILESYNPLADTARLKASPETFEQQRNSYTLREETSSFKC